MIHDKEKKWRMKYQLSFMKNIWSKKIIGCQILSSVVLKNVERKVKFIIVLLVRHNLRFIFKALLAFLLEHPNITGGRRNRFVAKIRCYRLQYYSNLNLGSTLYVHKLCNITVKENIIGILLETFHLTWVAFLDIFMTKNRLNQGIF